MNIAFLGLGAMGGAMARTLIRKGQPLAVYDPADLATLGADLAERGLLLVDAPVNRAPPEAETGNLLGLVGGDEAVVDRVMPILSDLCDTIHRMGGLGTGIRMKPGQQLHVDDQPRAHCRGPAA